MMSEKRLGLYIVVMITRIDLPQEMFFDMLRALIKSLLEHRRKYVRQWPGGGGGGTSI